MALPLIDRDPRDPDGPGPGRDIPDPPAPTTLPGEFGKKWRQLGGEKWGTPSFAPMTAPGGGRWVQFQLRNGSLVSMFSSSRTGTYVVSDRINRAWLRVGRSSGPLGFPRSDELPTHDKVGTHQVFEGGIIVWHPQLGAFEVHGAVYQRYIALGGSQFGYPTTDEGSTPDGAGKFNHFRNTATGGDASIYWTQTTGAHEVFGLIRGKWAKLGWERSPLGYPTSGELVTHDGTGRFAMFQRGLIVWHPSTGAFGSWGPINDRYIKIGGSAFGYPINDVGNAPGGGQYLHLRNLERGDDRSIYWHPSTGAHEVYGMIRGRWGELGWQTGFLGYPKGPEGPWAGKPGGRLQTFQGGQVFYDPRNGAYASPMTWFRTFKAGGFSGQVTIIASADGNVRMHGYVRSNALAGFKWTLQALLRSPSGQAVAFSEAGEVSGTHGSDEKDAFDRTIWSQVVVDRFPEFQRGVMELQHTHDNTFLASLGDLVEGLITWTAGAKFITPGVGLLLVTATSAVSLISSGSLVPGAKVIAGTLWLAGPAGAAFAFAADALVRVATEDREISDTEYEFANRVFKGKLPEQSKIRISNGLGLGGRPFTYPRSDNTVMVNLGDQWNDAIAATHGRCQTRGQLLIHELTHAWQYRNNAAYISYVADAIMARLSEDYEPGVEHKEPWSYFNIEEQGVLVDEWFVEHHTDDPANDHGLASTDAINDARYRYIRDHIHRGVN